MHLIKHTIRIAVYSSSISFCKIFGLNFEKLLFVLQKFFFEILKQQYENKTHQILEKYQRILHKMFAFNSS